MRSQRDPVPFNSTPPRRKDSRGGSNSTPLFRRTLAAGMDTESTRFPGTVNDALIGRDHSAWIPVPHYTPAGDSWVNWTAAGPPRPELSMRTLNLRTMQGTSRTRNLQDPDGASRAVAPGYRSTADGRIIQPTTEVAVGLHSRSPAAVARTRARFSETPQIRRPRQDRLRSGQYTGQSYSQTTRIQGA